MDHVFRPLAACALPFASLLLAACVGGPASPASTPGSTPLAADACQVRTAQGNVVVGSAVKGDPAASEPPSGFRLGKQAVRARSYMVSTANPLASAAACRTLAEGGNAADAAVVALTVLGLAEPQSSGLGGGAFVMYYDAATGRIASYDGRDTVPAAATENYLRWIDDAHDHRTPLPNPRASGRSVATPGAVRMLAMLHEDFGKHPWPTLFEPGIALARKGFPISGRLADALEAAKTPLARDPDAAALYLHPDGRPKALGERLDNLPYARTLEALAHEGADAFYRGPIAKAIVDKVQMTRGADGSEITPGRMTLGDLATYRAKRRDPALCSPYRNYWICGMPPPSSGGVAVAATLGILESFDLTQYRPGSGGPEGGMLHPMAVHLVSEAERLAYADRDKYVADSDFVPLPPGGLGAMLDASYLRARAQAISTDRTMGVAKPGEFGGRNIASEATAENGTTHVSIVDADGNAVSMTATVNSSFGAFRVAEGFVLNNVVLGMSANPTDAAGRRIANSVQPLKRPRSSMAPTLVFHRNADGGRGALYMVTGSPGSQAIIQYVVKTLIGVLDWKLDAQQATSLANFGADNTATTNLGGEHPLIQGIDSQRSDSLVKSLEAKGHKVSTAAQPSGVSTIILLRSGSQRLLEGGADPRREGIVVGY